MSDDTKPGAISDGPNARPHDTGLAQSGSGLPDDTGRAVPLDEASAQRIKEKLTGQDGEAETEAHPS